MTNSMRAALAAFNAQRQDRYLRDYKIYFRQERANHEKQLRQELFNQFRRLNINHRQFPEKYRDLFNQTRDEFCHFDSLCKQVEDQQQNYEVIEEHIAEHLALIRIHDDDGNLLLKKMIPTVPTFTRYACAKVKLTFSSVKMT